MPDESTLEMYEDEENFISDSEKVDQDEDLEDEVIPPKSASTKRPIGKKSKRINNKKEAVLKKVLTVLEKTGEKTQIKNQDEDEHDMMHLVNTYSFPIPENDRERQRVCALQNTGGHF